MKNLSVFEQTSTHADGLKNKSAQDSLAGTPKEPAILIENLGKCYRIWDKPQHRLMQAIFKRRQYYRDFWALRGINLHVDRGETVGVLGQNGSGKSTLLQVMAGTLAPSEGEVRVNGRVAALLELGSGFNPEFSGRENVILNGAIQGFSRRQMLERFDRIAAFADIGDFIDQPVKIYSSGMAVRLAFSVAINIDPEILIVDEALSVGDFRFQQRCMSRIREIRDNGASILFVTHDTDACKRLCNRVYVLEKGKLVHSGPADSAANWYQAFMVSLDGSVTHMSTDSAGHATNADAGPRVPDLPAAGNVTRPGGATERLTDFAAMRYGDGNGRIESCELLDSSGKAVAYAVMDEVYKVRFHLSFNVSCATSVLGFYMKDRMGTDIFGVNTHEEGVPIPPAQPGDRMAVEFEIPMWVRPGHYSISPALSYDRHGSRFFDYINHALIFRVIDRDKDRAVHGLVHPPVKTTITREAPAQQSATERQPQLAGQPE